MPNNVETATSGTATRLTRRGLGPADLASRVHHLPGGSTRWRRHLARTNRSRVGSALPPRASGCDHRSRRESVATIQGYGTHADSSHRPAETRVVHRTRRERSRRPATAASWSAWATNSGSTRRWPAPVRRVPAELAARAGCAERYVREWLNSQAAGGYVDYHAVSDTYELSPEQALVLADEDSPVFLPHAWQVPASMWFDEARAAEAFRTGAGVAWGDHDGRLACGVAAFYRNAYRGSLVPTWLPALDGVVDRLEAGISVADVGCGHGHSTILMAQAFPASRFVGFDGHRRRLRPRGSTHVPRASPTACDSRRHGPTATRADRTASSASSTACTTWATRWPRPGMRRRHSRPTAPSCWSSRSPTTASKATCSPVARMYYAASTTVCCAHAISGGRRTRARRAGRRGATGRRLPQGRLRARPARLRDAVQPDPRSAPLTRPPRLSWAVSGVYSQPVVAAQMLGPEALVEHDGSIRSRHPPPGAARPPRRWSNAARCRRRAGA